jgi:hypothetical protein
MEGILRFLNQYELIVYLVIGLLAAWQLKKFIAAWEELRAAAFGLEEESAQGRLNSSAAVLILLLIAAVLVYGSVTFLAPSLPGTAPLPTATLDLLATPTITLQPEVESEVLDVEATPEVDQESVSSGCLPGEVLITSPEDGTAVRDVVQVEGTANIPDFGFYKFEVSRDDAENWLTIQAGDTFKEEESLGFWDTTQLDPGIYRLRLVVFDNTGEPRDPCQVTVTVEPSSGE